MPVYEYEGKTKSGSPAAGVIEAPSRAVATLRLRQQGLWIEAIHEQGPARPGQPPREMAGARHWSLLYGLCPVTTGGMGNFFDQLGSLFKAGVPMTTLVNDLAGRVGSSRLRAILLQISPRIAQGESLGDCLASYPQVFPTSVLGLIRAGELPGNMDRSAHDLADDYNAEQRVWWLMMLPRLNYGTTLVLAALTPSFPWIILHGMPWWLNYVLHSIVPWFIVALAAFMLYRILWHLPQLTGLHDRLAYSVPIWAGLTRRVGLTRFYRALEMCVRAGVDFPTAINTAAQAAGNRVMIAKLREAETKMRAGVSVPDALAPIPFLGRDAQGVMGSAALAGTFDEALPHLAEQTKAARDNHIRLLRVGAVAVSFIVTAIITTVVAAEALKAIYSAEFQRAGVEDLTQ